ncbi:MAG: hypothetical protein Q9181_007981, partial [Wetmoreana brouardii]
MGKKRKSNGRNVNGQGTGEAPEEDSKRTINTYEDVADSEDEFFINRDKILLDEGPAQKKRRKLEEDEALLEPSDEEVLSEPSDASDSGEEDAQDPGGFSPKLIPPRINDQGQEYTSDASGVPAEEDNQDAYGWGGSRKDYYDADPITTEADALEEEAEARRLQKKQLQGMTEADFGFDQVDWTQAGKESMNDRVDDVKGKVISEVLPTVEITDSMSPEEKLKILRMRYPEFEPLAKEYVDLQALYQDLSLASKAASAVESNLPSGENGGSTTAAVKLNALGAYLAALCMYFALLSATDTSLDDTLEIMPPAELHDHKIMDTLVRCRQLWEKVKDMKVPEPAPLVAVTNGRQASTEGKEDGAITKPQSDDQTRQPRKRKSNSAKKAARALAVAQAESEARRLERLRQTEESLKDLSSLTSLKPHLTATKTTKTTKTSTKAMAENDNDSDLGEPTHLTTHEAAQKALRKKSIRFYTSQIAQKSNKREAAGRDAGGDADIPYRERLKDRQVRLNSEAEARGKKGRDSGVGASLAQNGSGGENEEEQGRLAREVRSAEDEDYYDLVASRAADKKTLKAAHAQAAREGGVVRILDPDEAGVGADGKRGISYAIEKNKGLAPKRKKDVRNPRVRKRKKFEDKKKKLGSVRQIYKGGEGRGG